MCQPLTVPSLLLYLCLCPWRCLPTPPCQKLCKELELADTFISCQDCSFWAGLAGEGREKEQQNFVLSPAVCTTPAQHRVFQLACSCCTWAVELSLCRRLQLGFQCCVCLMWVSRCLSALPLLPCGKREDFSLPLLGLLLFPRSSQPGEFQPCSSWCWCLVLHILRSCHPAWSWGWLDHTNA